MYYPRGEDSNCHRYLRSKFLFKTLCRSNKEVSKISKVDYVHLCRALNFLVDDVIVFVARVDCVLNDDKFSY